MTWEDFLNDSELNDEAARDRTVYPGPPNGELLLRQVSHDVRGCLNTFINIAPGIQLLTDRISASTLECVSRWTPIVYAWRSEILAVHATTETLSATSPEWAQKVARIGDIVHEAPKFRAEMESLVPPDDATAQSLIQLATNKVILLDHLWHDIQVQEYKRLYRMRG